MERSWSFWVATWFGSGMLKPGSGTWGSFFSLPLCVWLFQISKSESWEMKIFFWAIVILIIFLAGIFSIPNTERVLGERKNWRGKMVRHDQSQIVIDEVFGMLITSIPLLFFTIHSYFLAFGLVFAFFRFFDVVKIPPTNFFDHMENKWGVMLDDGVAGIYAAICLFTTLHFFKL